MHIAFAVLFIVTFTTVLMSMMIFGYVLNNVPAAFWSMIAGCVFLAAFGIGMAVTASPPPKRNNRKS
jgi:hypothetical protein